MSSTLAASRNIQTARPPMPAARASTTSASHRINESPASFARQRHADPAVGRVEWRGPGGGLHQVNLAHRRVDYHALRMFIVTEADAEAIRDIFNRKGELSAAIELRRRFPGITDNAKAREFVRTIAGWTPLPASPASVIPLRPRRTKAVRRDDPDPEG